MIDVGVLIPALDEEEALPAVLRTLPRSGDGWRLAQVVVADNGSRDRTAEAALAAGARVIREARRGYGSACLAGLATMRPAPPELVAFLDADGSDDPTELPALLRPLVRGEADLVIGSRVLGESEPGSLAWPQRIGNRIASVLLAALFGARATDLGPFRAIRWDALERLRLRDRDFGWTVEMQARAARARLRVAEIPVRALRRRGGRSKVSGTWSGVAGASWKILVTLLRVRLGG